MPFKIRDLMFTVVPNLEHGARFEDGGTVGSCTSEHDRVCQVSTEVLELTPYAHVNPPYLQELRKLLQHALASNGVVVPGGVDVVELEKQMRPQTVEEINVLEKRLLGALEELRAQKAEIEKFVQDNPGWIASKTTS